MTMKRNRRSGVEDRWTRTVRDAEGNESTVPSANHGKGSRWRARYVDENSNEHAKGFSRKADAQQWLNKQVSDQVTGTWTDPKLSGVSFGDFAERWFLTKATRAPSTVAGYRSLLDTVVLPRWEDVALRDVSFIDLQEWVSGLSVDGSTRRKGKGLGPSRVIQAHQVVSQVLKFAVRAKHLPANPADSIELPRKPETELRFLDHDQLHRLAIASGRLRTFVFVLGYCGLRFGEAAALRVGHLDLNTRRIRVQRSVTYVTGKGLVEGPTKGHAARSVPVPSFLIPLLRTEVGDRADGELVFPSRNVAGYNGSRNEGGWLTEGEVRWVMDPAAKAVGQEGLTPHELRHTCASLAIRAGANIKVLQKLMGHKTATLTWDRYGHLYPDDLDTVADVLDVAAKSTADALRTVGPLRAVLSE